MNTATFSLFIYRRVRVPFSDSNVLALCLWRQHDEIRRVKHILETGALSELVRDQLAVKLAVLEVFASL